MELTTEQLQFKSGIRQRRRGKLDELMDSEAGRLAIDEMVMFIASRASVRSAAARIGVNPNTLTKWISRGKQEEEGVYRELYGRVVVALGQATAEAEVELNQMKPETYLTKGPGRILLGDFYNTELPTAEYNVDGTVTLATSEHNPTGLIEREPDTEHIATSEQKSIERQVEQDNQLTIEALASMREAGIDINTVIDNLVSENNQKKITDDDSTIEGSVSVSDECTEWHSDSDWIVCGHVEYGGWHMVWDS